MADIAACLSSEKSDWQTPEDVLDLVRQFAPIHLDPCTTKDNPVGASRYYAHPEKDGLSQAWYEGLAFCNPPYGKEVEQWVRKCATEACRNVETIALLPARTDTKWFQSWVLRQASAILWWRGRIKFVGAESSAPFPSVLVYYGESVDRFERVMSAQGVVTFL